MILHVSKSGKWLSMAGAAGFFYAPSASETLKGPDGEKVAFDSSQDLVRVDYRSKFDPHSGTSYQYRCRRVAYLDSERQLVKTPAFEEMVAQVRAPLKNPGCLGDRCYSNLSWPQRLENQQLLAIDWARSSAAAELPINATAGVGVAGHSMGGQASVFAAAYNASGYNIKAAAMHPPEESRHPGASRSTC